MVSQYFYPQPELFITFLGVIEVLFGSLIALSESTQTCALCRLILLCVRVAILATRASVLIVVLRNTMRQSDSSIKKPELESRTKESPEKAASDNAAVSTSQEKPLEDSISKPTAPPTSTLAASPSMAPADPTSAKQVDYLPLKPPEPLPSETVESLHSKQLEPLPTSPIDSAHPNSQDPIPGKPSESALNRPSPVPFTPVIPTVPAEKDTLATPRPSAIPQIPGSSTSSRPQSYRGRYPTPRPEIKTGRAETVSQEIANFEEKSKESKTTVVTPSVIKG